MSWSDRAVRATRIPLADSHPALHLPTEIIDVFITIPLSNVCRSHLKGSRRYEAIPKVEDNVKKLDCETLSPVEGSELVWAAALNGVVVGDGLGRGSDLGIRPWDCPSP